MVDHVLVIGPGVLLLGYRLVFAILGMIYTMKIIREPDVVEAEVTPRLTGFRVRVKRAEVSIQTDDGPSAPQVSPGKAKRKGRHQYSRRMTTQETIAAEAPQSAGAGIRSRSGSKNR